ncbi:hypothetical protein LIER_25310 [Lithospermum erythrorhizon]|uniref:CCHC-type domain-containing protein n=1 Tax=Lithospermum erythrorhizon TaxID=34254 RepID=A0AAV3R5Q1_LITER
MFLLGNYSDGRPTIAIIKEFFMTLKLKGDYNLSLYDTKLLFIECELLDDYTKLWIRLPLMKETWINFVDEDDPSMNDGFLQKVEYDVVPHYCSSCFHMGHMTKDCKRDLTKQKDQINSNRVEIRRRQCRRVHNPAAKNNKTPANANENAKGKVVVPRDISNIASTSGEKCDTSAVGNTDKFPLVRRGNVIEKWMKKLYQRKDPPLQSIPTTNSFDAINYANEDEIGEQLVSTKQLSEASDAKGNQSLPEQNTIGVEALKDQTMHPTDPIVNDEEDTPTIMDNNG